jgi:hypothetical protein
LFILNLLDINSISVDIRTAMKQKFFNIAGDKIKTLRFFILFISFPLLVNAQPASNLEIFYSLVDSVSTDAAKNISSNNKQLNITFELGIYFTIFENRIISQFSKNDIKILRGAESNNNYPNLNFVIDNAEVFYGEQERDGFLGDFYVTRDIILSGNYLLTSGIESFLNKGKEFEYTFSDRIKVEDIEKIENRSYPFTQGTLPPEPFFSSLLEPVIAVGAAALAIILFFSVRSK